MKSNKNMLALIGAFCASTLLPAVLADPQNPDVHSLGWKYGYCWFTPNTVTGSSVFNGTAYITSSMTVETCLSHCRQTTGGGPFLYAGIKNGNECYCSNQPAEDRGSLLDDDCDMPCAGNSGEKCGGSGALSTYIWQNGRTALFTDLSYYPGLGYKGCYTLDAATQQNAHKYGFDDNMESLQFCLAFCAFDDNNNVDPNFMGFSVGNSHGNPGWGPDCYCNPKFDYSLYQPVDPVHCSQSCAGDPGQKCGGYQYFVHYSLNKFTDKDITNAKKSTSRSSWAYSITSASRSRATLQASVATSKAIAFSSRNSARTSIAQSQATASSSRATARASVATSKALAATTRTSNRNHVASSQASASSSRATARATVAASQLSASLSRATARQSVYTSKSLAQSRYTSSSLSKNAANAAYSTASAWSAASRATARALYTTRSNNYAASKYTASSLKSASRSAASLSRGQANASNAASKTSASISRSSASSSASWSQYQASTSRSSAYSSLSYSAYLASSSRSLYYSSINAAKTTTTTTVHARWGQIISVTTTIVIDTSSSEAFTPTLSLEELPEVTTTA